MQDVNPSFKECLSFVLNVSSLHSLASYARVSVPATGEKREESRKNKSLESFVSSEPSSEVT